MPTLIVVVILALLAGWFILPKDLLSDFATSIPPALFSFSNIHFWTTTGYFDQAAEFKPLLHTWSLGVEEQFYLFWPVIVLFTVWKQAPTNALEKLILLIVMFVITAGVSDFDRNPGKN